MKLRKTFALAFVAMAIFAIFSNNVSAGQNQCKITGRILDAASKDALVSATVSVHKPADSSVVGGSVTDKQGNFAIEDIAEGNYYIKVSYVGYSDKVVPGVTIDKSKNLLDVKEIFIEQSSSVTGEVNVSGTRPDVTYSMGKTVINVDKNLAAAGGSVIDALKTSPSVEVTTEGKIKLRGSENVRILVDGKPAPSLGSNPGQALQQLPAAAVESIELITNPSAKYEAEGQSGIINIVLSKSRSRAEGLSGMLSGNVGSRDKYTGSVNTNYRNGFYNIFANYDYRREISPIQQEIRRVTYLGDSIYKLNLDAAGLHQYFVHSVKGGAELDFGAGYSMNAFGVYKYVGQTVGNNNKYNNYNQFDLLTSTNSRNILIDQPNTGMDLALSFKKIFETKGMEWTLDAYWSTWSLDGKSDFDWSTYSADGNLLGYTAKDKLASDMFIDYKILQSDFVLPFSWGDKLETGYKGEFKNMDTDLDYSTFNNGSSAWARNEELSSEYKNQENVHALYAMYSGTAGDFDYQAGLRMESTIHDADIISQGKKLNKSYTDFFPTAVLSYKFSQFDQLQLSYSRRINRPHFTMYNPIKHVNDPMNVIIGNPNIKPEFTDSYELGFIKNFESHMFMPSLFYRNTKDNMFMNGYVDSTGVMYFTFDNISDGEFYGLDFSYQGRLFGSLGLNFNFSYYKQEIHVKIPGNEYDNSDFSWSFRGGANYTIIPGLVVQLFGYYNPEVVTSLGKRIGFYSVDFSSRWDVTPDLSLNFRVSDIFESLEYGGQAKGSNYNFTNTYFPESRNAYLGISYKFNNYTRPREKQSPGGIDGSSMPMM